MSKQSPEDRQRFMDGMRRADELTAEMKALGSSQPDRFSKINEELIAVLDSIRDIVPDDADP